MKKLLTSPSKMSLSAYELAIYQNILKLAEPLSLNLMAVKITERPDNFNGWCKELVEVCDERVNFDLLDEEQIKPLKKLSVLLKSGLSLSQLRMATIAPWPIFADLVQAQQHQALDERSRLLSYVAKLRETPLSEMLLQDRLVIAGKHTNAHDPAVYDFDVQWFGSTKTAKGFHHLVEHLPHCLDQALAHIPLEGEVSKEQYDLFISEYVSAFDDIEDSPTLIPATRLLAMRRPDQFVCLTSSKMTAFSQAFETKINDFEKYWNGMVQSVRQMHWWRSAEPEDSQEIFLWQHRAILIDMLTFAEPSLAQKSNYIKLRDKPKRSTSTSAPKRVKKTKETAEALVDRVLETRDVEDFIIAQRTSIVAQVQNGKSIDEVITLIRKIFS